MPIFKGLRAPARGNQIWVCYFVKLNKSCYSQCYLFFQLMFLYKQPLMMMLKQSRAEA